MIPIRKQILSQTLLVPCVCSLLLATPVQARWGAVEPDSADRPSLSWLSLFSSKADVVATGDIKLAIEQCDRKVGADNYCAVELRTTISGPFSVNRSKTRIFASLADDVVSKRAVSEAEASKGAVLAAPGQATISIGSDTEKVIIENLRLVGARAGYRPIYAIVVSGSNIKDIVIRNNRISNYDSASSAHGIVILGTGTTNARRVEGITIDNNHIHDMRTGASESIAINGNVTNWVIRANRIERVNNIAIDAIGGEGTAAPVTMDGRVVPNPLDAARNGWIEKNVVNSMSTLDNPAYGRTRSWAGAIYIDGARNVVITDNKVDGAPWAYDIGAENCVIAENITMRNNTATNSHFGDLRLGGYTENGYLADPSINCDPRNTEDSNEGHGYVRRLTIAGNEFRSVTTDLPQIFVEYRTTQSIIAEPGITPLAGNGDGSAVGDANAFRTIE